MGAALRVRLTPALKREPAPAALAVLHIEGPRRVFGDARSAENLAIPVRPDASTLFGPRGACLLRARGPLWVSDTGHHRLLGWAEPPAADDSPADWVIGQPNFTREGRNAKGPPGPATLNVPTGICALGETAADGAAARDRTAARDGAVSRVAGCGMAVADAWNHRVLLWRRSPTADNTPADLVLGQSDFTSIEANRGAAGASAQSLFWPYGVHWDGTGLWVADSGNRRVLHWRGLPERNGQPADLVLGQSRFDCRDENGGGDPSARSMRWPHAITTWGGNLCVTDAGNNRILVWRGVPGDSNAPAEWVLGQNDFRSVDHNQSLYWPGPATLHMPYGVAAAGPWCLAADTANSRLIAWHLEDCRTGAAARALTGQAEFNDKGDNGWRLPTRQSLSWPYGLSVTGSLCVIADSGNNRVLLWPLAPELVPSTSDAAPPASAPAPRAAERAP
jgi:hypothetical protein